MHWKLKVAGYGKIERAEIEVAPLTLFVGDNNSGKSYLMSLLWAVQNFGVEGLLGQEYSSDKKSVYALTDWFQRQMDAACKVDVHTVCASEIAVDLQIAVRDALDDNKSNLAKRIFNSQDMKIEKLEIELTGMENIFLRFQRVRDGEVLLIKSISEGSVPVNAFAIKSEGCSKLKNSHLVRTLLGLVTGIPFYGADGEDSIYLPAARTGFMLTKDIINKVGRNTVFNLEMEQRELTPFTRPVNQFLDVMDSLTSDNKGRPDFRSIIEYLENGMADGILEMNTLPNKAVSYVPAGGEKGLPLRVISAVVTELAPLILILKHKETLKTLFYEEPEMCLHPQLQQKMGKVICRLVNKGLNMVLTTHSDIILQYINNMIALSGRNDKEKICSDFGYTSDDIMDAGQVKVYQLKCKSDGKTEVEELICGTNGFAVPTFNDALDSIMDEAYAIQE